MKLHSFTRQPAHSTFGQNPKQADVDVGRRTGVLPHTKRLDLLHVIV
jgi:hypothetical protein